MAMTMTQKDVKVGIKNGLDIEAFCLKFGYADEDEFLRYLSFVYPHPSDKMMMQLRQNEKKQRRSKRTQKTELKKGGMPVNNDTLSTLQDLEASQSKHVIELENKHKDLASSHKECLKALRAIKEAMDQLEEEYREKSSEYEQVVIKNNKLVSEMNIISSELSEKRSELNVTRQQIENLKRVSILVYANGELEVVEGNVNLDFTGAENIFDQLVRDTRCEVLTVKQIRTLSKVMSIKSAQKIEFTFDEEPIKNAFLSLTSTELLTTQ